MWISHAGEWFKQTNGGLPMNDDDAIIALKMQRLSHVAQQLEKKKKTFAAVLEKAELANAVLEAKGNNPTDWTVKELSTMIKSKAPDVAISQKQCHELLALWEKHKDDGMHHQRPSCEWTEKNQRQLEKAQSGNISCIERTHLMRRATKLTGEFLSLKLSSTLPKEELFNVITHAIRERIDDEKNELANKILHSDEFEDMFYCESEDDDVLVSTLDVESLLDNAGGGDDDDQEDANDDLLDAVDDEDFVSQPSSSSRSLDEESIETQGEA
jgi:hypothetical protein